MGAVKMVRRREVEEKDQKVKEGGHKEWKRLGYLFGGGMATKRGNLEHLPRFKNFA